MADALSLIVLTIIPLGCLWPLVKAFRSPSDYTSLEKVLYAPVYCFGRLLWRIEIVSHAPMNEGKTALGVSGAVLISNHRNSLDPFFLQLACGRRVHWLVAGEFFKNPIFGPVLRTFRAIPTNRSGSDSASVKTAIRLVSEGRLVGMFPEGRINRTKCPILKIRAGAALVAIKANAPLLPCWIEGAPRGWDVWSGWFTAAHIKVFIGHPVYPTHRNGLTPMLLDESVIEPNQQHETDRFIETAMTQSLTMAGHGDCPVDLARKRLNHTKPIS
jgi:1-acyl-sn-glycerol-3-phosphate acyltransferase